MSRINNVLTDNAEGLDVVMPMYNLLEYSKNYSKTSDSLWNYYRDEPVDPIKNSKSFNYKTGIIGKPAADGNLKEIDFAVLLKYLSNFWYATN